jgi:chemotaxis protein methyltransferase CheR
VWQRLIHAVTIGETYFFSNSPQLEALRMEVFPALINERRKAGILQLRIWSAGCATGEEPYSIAIMLRELLPDIEAWNISLLATDINVNFLQEARAGLYRNKSFRNETPEVVRERWFISGENDFQIKPIIQKMVSFRHLNLITDDYPSYDSSTMHMDVILCRNVTIYFSSDTTRQVASRFYRALNHNGWLVVGHSEQRADVY